MWARCGRESRRAREWAWALAGGAGGPGRRRGAGRGVRGRAAGLRSVGRAGRREELGLALRGWEQARERRKSGPQGRVGRGLSCGKGEGEGLGRFGLVGLGFTFSISFLSLLFQLTQTNSNLIEFKLNFEFKLYPLNQ